MFLVFFFFLAFLPLIGSGKSLSSAIGGSGATRAADGVRARKERAVSMKTNTYNEFKSAPTSSAADHALPPLALVRRRLAPGLATSSSAIFSFSWMRANLDSLGSLGFLGFSHAIFYWILACDLLLDFLDFLESAIFCISWISWILACDRVYGNIPTQTDTTHARTRANERTLQQGS